MAVAGRQLRAASSGGIDRAINVKDAARRYMASSAEDGAVLIPHCSSFSRSST